MSVGLLIISHERVATVMAEAAIRMLGACPIPLAILHVPTDSDPERMRAEAETLIETLDEGEGVLVLTDIYGSTPSNVAFSLVDPKRVRMVTGINLPMLIKIMNYPYLSLPELTRKALSGGREGVIMCPEEEGI
jgi:PTS system ascorbate-specific IIA component